jgi:hypothetical protein
MTTVVSQAGRHLRVDEIHVPDNVRALDDAHVQALAGSIELQGILVPLVVRERGDGYELVAGFHRMASARAIGLTDVPVTVREADSEDADRAMSPRSTGRCAPGRPRNGGSQSRTSRSRGSPHCRTTSTSSRPMTRPGQPPADRTLSRPRLPPAAARDAACQ